MSSPVEQIKERLSIEEVVSSYLKLQKAGKNWKAKCPFHNEKTASFFVSPDRGGYYCFGCGAKGDIFTFVEEFEGLDFRGALKLLAERAGVILPAYNPKAEDEKEKLYSAMEEAVRFYESALERNTEAREYLKRRGLQQETIESFRLGYAPDGWRALLEQLKKDFPISVLSTAGLVKRSDDGGDYYDRFRRRIIFPMADSSGRIIALSGRIFPEREGEEEAKYLNSPDTPIFSKSFVLYGLDRAKSSIRKNNFSILVEGQMDLVLSHQAGFKNTVATSGTALSDSIFSETNVVSNFGLLRRLSGNIIFAFDADKAGTAASERATKVALALGMDVKIADLAGGKDPAEIIASGGPEAWKKAVRNSKHIVEFMLGKVKATAKDARGLGKEIREKVLPYVRALESAIEKRHFLKRISEESGISEKALEEDLSKAPVEESGVADLEEREERLGREERIARRLLGIIFWQETLSDPEIAPEKIKMELTEMLPESERRTNESEKNDLIFEAEAFYEGSSEIEEEVRELLLNLKEEQLRGKLQDKMRELAKVEGLGKSSPEILKDCQEISAEIERIKNSRVKVSL
ncbi:MAG: DNA primase [Patescibacteria group bacterium]